jgi:hypothetical protein
MRSVIELCSPNGVPKWLAAIIAIDNLTDSFNAQLLIEMALVNSTIESESAFLIKSTRVPLNVG